MIHSLFRSLYLLIFLVNSVFSAVMTSNVPAPMPCIQGTPGCTAVMYSNGTTGYAAYPSQTTYPSNYYPSTAPSSYIYTSPTTTQTSTYVTTGSFSVPAAQQTTQQLFPANGNTIYGSMPPAPQTITVAAQKTPAPQTITVAAQKTPAPQTITVAAPTLPAPQTITVAAPTLPAPQTITVAAPTIQAPQTITVAAQKNPAPQTITVAAQKTPAPQTITVAAPTLPAPQTITVAAPTIPAQHTITVAAPTTVTEKPTTTVISLAKASKSTTKRSIETAPTSTLAIAKYSDIACGEGGTKCDSKEACLMKDNSRLCKHGDCMKGGASCKAVVPCPKGGLACWYVMSTIAGNGKKGNTGDNDLAISATINEPKGIAIDDSHHIYIADEANKNVRKISSKTGIIKTLENSIGISASSLAVDRSNKLYTVNNSSHNIKKLETDSDDSNIIMQNITSGNVRGIAVDRNGDIIFTDVNEHVIKKIANKKVTIIAGTAKAAGYEKNCKKFNAPKGIAIAPNGEIYVADSKNHVIRKIHKDNKKQTYDDVIIAGTPSKEGYAGDNGKADDAKLNSPTDIDIDRFGNIYISDTGNHVIRVVWANSKKISTIAGRHEDDPKANRGIGQYDGDGRLATKAHLNKPTNITVDAYGNVYIVDENNHRIRKLKLHVETGN